MSAAKFGDRVIVHYTAKLADGTVLADSENDQPLRFTLGSGSVIEDFEEAIVGMNPGQSKITQMRGEKLFGKPRKQKIIELDRHNVDKSQLKIGKRIRVPGERFSVKVVGFSESKVKVDVYHPLSDRNVIFAIKLVDIV